MTTAPTATATLAAEAAFEIEIKKSRFLARAVAADSPEAALAFTAAVADPQATHTCWAYRIGAQYRFNDDGEPAGTAGRPILAAIQGQGCDRVVVAVTRWYGGVKLGAGGLVRAYGGAAAECLRRAERVPLIARVELRLDCAWSELAALQARLRDFAAEPLEQDFGGDRVRLRIVLPADRVDAFTAWHRDLTRGRGRIEIL